MNVLKQCLLFGFDIDTLCTLATLKVFREVAMEFPHLEGIYRVFVGSRNVVRFRNAKKRKREKACFLARRKYEALRGWIIVFQTLIAFLYVVSAQVRAQPMLSVEKR